MSNMKIARKTTLAVVALCMASGCDVTPDDEEIDDDGEVAEELGETADTLCDFPVPVQPYDSTSVWTGATSWSSPGIAGAYGTDPCDYWVKDLTSVDLQEGGINKYATVGPYAQISTPAACQATVISRKHWYQTGGSTWYEGPTWFYYGQWFDGLIDYCYFSLPYINAPANMTRLRVAARVRNMSTNTNMRVVLSKGSYPH